MCLTFFVQGCNLQCPGCHNQVLWDFNGGREFNKKTLDSVLTGLEANGISRDFCIMGGEPLCYNNYYLTYLLTAAIKRRYPKKKIYIWTGYTYEYLKEHRALDKCFNNIIELADYLIDGKYIESQRDITLPMRGSRNQNIWNLKTGEKENDKFR